MMGDTSNALETFTILISLVPTDPSVLAKVGELYHKMGEESLALQFYLESYRYYPVNIDVISYLGSYYLQMGVYEKAIGFFRRASQIQPEKVVWPLRVAKCQTQHKDLQGALRTLERANSSFPNESDCLLQLIKVCEGLNLNEKAREYKRQWQKIDRKGGSKSSVDDTFDFSASASTTSSNAGTSSSSRRASPAGFGTSMSTGTSNNSHGMDYGSSSSSSTSFGNDFGSAKNSSPASGGYGSGSGSGSGMGMGLGSMSSSSSSSSSSPKFGGASSGLDREWEWDWEACHHLLLPLHHHPSLVGPHRDWIDRLKCPNPNNNRLLHHHRKKTTMICSWTMMLMDCWTFELKECRKFVFQSSLETSVFLVFARCRCFRVPESLIFGRAVCDDANFFFRASRDAFTAKYRLTT
eukprot:TRINITY_DN2314_c0_g2_i2.p1 TRINITY_DN2314_c0_g2~~TRINITY_DN2314_c0_g2_i2.p1  ORF type:complete len:409 (+),score=118.11 TRINITY_DN2314_c0_g2_i2:152-1378(+)